MWLDTGLGASCLKAGELHQVRLQAGEEEEEERLWCGAPEV